MAYAASLGRDGPIQNFDAEVAWYLRSATPAVKSKFKQLLYQCERNNRNATAAAATQRRLVVAKHLEILQTLTAEKRRDYISLNKKVLDDLNLNLNAMVDTSVPVLIQQHKQAGSSSARPSVLPVGNFQPINVAATFSQAYRHHVRSSQTAPPSSSQHFINVPQQFVGDNSGGGVIDLTRENL